MSSKFTNRDIFAPWNDLLLQDDLFAPWNNSLFKNDVYAPWNKIIATKEDTNNFLKKISGINPKYFWK